MILLGIIFGTMAILFSMVGVGGAVFYVPVLYFSGLPKSIVVSTALALNIANASSSSFNYLRKRLVHFNLAFPLIVSSMLGAYLGSQIKIETQLFVIILTLILFFVGIIMFFNVEELYQLPTLADRHDLILSLIIGFLAGFISGLVGLAGGSFFVPLLIYLLRIDPKEAVATSFLVIIFSSLSGFTSYFLQGAVDFSLLTPLFLFVFFGAQVGSYFMLKKLNATQVKRLLGIILLLIAGQLLWKIF